MHCNVPAIDQPCRRQHHRFSLELNIEMCSAPPGCHTPEIDISLEYLQYSKNVTFEYLGQDLFVNILLFHSAQFHGVTPVTLEEIHLNQNVLGCPVNTFQFEYKLEHQF